MHVKTTKARREQMKRWRENNPNYMKEYNKKNKERLSAYQQQHYRKRVAWFNDWVKLIHCEYCGFPFDRWTDCCDFHHKDPTQKKFSLSYQASYTCEKVVEELDKCIALCANCHRILHQAEKEDGL